MDTSTSNRLPENIRRIHLIAVCGTGMGALACMLKESGYEVTGSDQNVYPPMSRFLQEKGWLEPERLAAAAYSHYQPVASNDTAEGRRQNRRIEIILAPSR